MSVAAFYQKEIDKQLTTNSSFLSMPIIRLFIPQYAEGQSLTSIWAVFWELTLLQVSISLIVTAAAWQTNGMRFKK